MKNDPEVTHNNSHVGPSVQNKATGQQTLVLYQTPAQQIFQRGIANILNKKESCIENDVKTRCLQLRIWRSWHDTIHMPHSNLKFIQFHPSLEQNHRQMETDLHSTLQKDGWVPPLTQTPGTPGLALLQLALALLALAFPAACKANLGKKGR